MEAGPPNGRGHTGRPGTWPRKGEPAATETGSWGGGCRPRPWGPSSSPATPCWGEGVARCHLCPECSLPCDCAHKGAWGGGGGIHQRLPIPPGSTGSVRPAGKGSLSLPACPVPPPGPRQLLRDKQSTRVCVFISVCMYAPVCTCVHMHARACSHGCAHLCVRAHVHVHVCTAVSVVGECARVRTCVSAPSVLKTPLGVTRCGARPLCRGRRGCEEGLWLPVTLLRSRLGTRRCVAG